MTFPCLFFTFASAAMGAETFSLDSAKGLQTKLVTVEPASYLGRKCIRVIPANGGPQGGGGGLAILGGTEFHDGTIELDVAGKPGAGAGGDARGFVGVAFRVQPAGDKYEAFYIRPTNGRADDQERRNHATQYISLPDYEWFRLRKETPSKYEAYADMVTGEWTHLKVEVQGVKARLYVNGASQPTLLVNDLKAGDSKGAVALWIGVGTEAHFANLKIN
jgi:hypothetical protein